MNTSRLQTAVALVIPVLNAGFLIAAVLFEDYFFHFTILALIIADVLLYLYVPQGTHLKRICKFAALPFLHFTATAGALFFSNNATLTIFLIASLLCLHLAYLLGFRNTFTRENTAYALPSILIVYCYAIFFSLSVLFFSLMYFLDIPFWYLIIPFTLIITLAQEFVFLEMRVEKYVRLLIESSAIIAVTELFYALSWLPLEYAPLAGLGTLAYVVYLDVFVCNLRKTCSNGRILFSGVSILFMIVLILLFSRWR